jgi:hypothetical protein
MSAGLEELHVHLQMSLNEVNLILTALSELPYKVSFALIQKIREQGEQQYTAARTKGEQIGDPTAAPR